MLDDEVCGVLKHVNWQLGLVFFVMRRIRRYGVTTSYSSYYGTWREYSIIAE